MGEKMGGCKMLEGILSVLKFIFMGLSDEKTSQNMMKFLILSAKASVVVASCYIFTSSYFKYEKANIDSFNKQILIATQQVKDLEKELSGLNNEIGVLKSEMLETRDEQNKIRTTILEHEKRLTRVEVIQNKLRSR